MLIAIVSSAACVALTIALASGLVVGGKAPLAVTAFVLLVVWCFTHRRVDQTLAALALYLGLLDGYVKLSTGSSTVTLARDVLVVAIAAGALFRSLRLRRPLRLPPLGVFVVAFTVVVVVELANPASRGLTVGLAGVRQHLEFVPLFFLGYAFVRTESQLRTALLVIVVCAAAGGVVSYIQSTLTPDQLAGWGPGYAQRIVGTGVFTGAGRTASVGTSTFVRPFGLGSDAGSGASIAALALPAVVALLIVGGQRLRVAVALMAVGVGLAIATSGSRGAFGVVFVTLIAFGLTAAASKNAPKAVLGVALGFALVYATFVQVGTDNASSQRTRSIASSTALSTFQAERGPSVAALGGLLADHPLGVGLATAGPASGFQRATAVVSVNAETQWNFLVVETGIAGLIVYVTFLLRLTWLACTRIRRVGGATERLLLAALAAPIVGMLVAGFLGTTSVSVPTAPYLWLVSGVLAYWLVTKQNMLARPHQSA